VSLEEAVLAKAFQLKALMTMLERKDMVKKAGVLEEIKPLPASTPTARWRHYERRG
jgi:hypothetical protein